VSAKSSVDWAANQPVIYSSKAFVRRRKMGHNWVTWSDKLGGGPTLLVRTESLEVLAPRGTMLESRHIVMAAKDTTMRLDSVGWAGTPFGRKKCIRLSGRDGRFKVVLAVTPESGIHDAWEALRRAGVRP
jgi:hypothetical protein